MTWYLVRSLSRRLSLLVAAGLLLACGCTTPREAPNGVNEPPRGVIEQPADGAIQPRSFMARGWAGDDQGIRAVRVFVDDKLVALATFVSERPDVTKVFPHFRHGTDRHGWETSVEISEPGEHRIRAEAVDTNDATSDLGERSITVSVPSRELPLAASVSGQRVESVPALLQSVRTAK